MKQFILLTVLTILMGFGTVPVYADVLPCKVSTAQEMDKCTNQLNSGTVSSIEVTKPILCTNTNLCRFTITSTSGGTIFGTPGSGAGFFRNGAGSYNSGVYGAPVFQFTNASNITVANLIFEDN
jgi:hypothetical protein